MEKPKINWEKLAKALREQRCVLLLGPAVCCDFKADSQPMSKKLALHLSGKIIRHSKEKELISADTLSYVAKEYEDTPFENERLTDRKARQYLGKAIQNFYETHKDSRFEFYEKLAKMPFHIIINTGHFDFLNTAILREGKGLQEYYFNYKKPEHNADLKFDQPIARNPLVYNLFGNIHNTESLVVTEADQIRFVEEVMQKEATASLPTDLRVLLKEEGLTFLFIGFDFADWHLRILLHVLELNKQNFTLVLQEEKEIAPLTHFLYTNHFSAHFNGIHPLSFLHQLDEHRKMPVTSLPPAIKKSKRLFIMYSDKDEALRDELEKHLKMLDRNDVVNEIWHEGKMLGGDKIDETIAQEISEADIILLIITQHFLASDKLYENQLAQALKRHADKQSCIIPLIMSPCDWTMASFEELPTILPRNGEPVGQENRTERLTKIVNGINEIINHFEWK